MEIITDLNEYIPPVGQYLIADPSTCQISSDHDYLLNYVEKEFVSLYGRKPDRCWWVYGYEIAVAGPIPEITRLQVILDEASIE